MPEDFHEDSIFSVRVGDVVEMGDRPGSYKSVYVLVLEVPDGDQPRTPKWSLDNFGNDVKLWDFNTNSILYMSFNSLVMHSSSIFSKG